MILSFLHPLLAIENVILAPVIVISLLDYKLWGHRAHVLFIRDL